MQAGRRERGEREIYKTVGDAGSEQRECVCAASGECVCV